VTEESRKLGIGWTGGKKNSCVWFRDDAGWVDPSMLFLIGHPVSCLVEWDESISVYD
jgi:hypothetical protein